MPRVQILPGPPLLIRTEYIDRELNIGDAPELLSKALSSTTCMLRRGDTVVNLGLAGVDVRCCPWCTYEPEFCVYRN